MGESVTKVPLKRVFLDTNILLDVLLARDPFCEPAQRVWTWAEQGRIKGGISSLSISHIFFIVRKLASRDKAYQAVAALVGIFKIVEIGGATVKKALAMDFDDFEDALQYCAAISFRAKAVLTRDREGFAAAKIPVMDCAEFLALS